MIVRFAVVVARVVILVVRIVRGLLLLSCVHAGVVALVVVHVMAALVVTALVLAMVGVHAVVVVVATVHAAAVVVVVVTSMAAVISAAVVVVVTAVISAVGVIVVAVVTAMVAVGIVMVITAAVVLLAVVVAVGEVVSATIVALAVALATAVEVAVVVVVRGGREVAVAGRERGAEELGVVQRQAGVRETSVHAGVTGAVGVTSSAVAGAVAGGVRLGAADIVGRVAATIGGAGAFAVRGDEVPGGGVRDLRELLGAAVSDLADLLGVRDASPAESVENLVVGDDVFVAVKLDEGVSKIAMAHVINRQVQILESGAAEVIEELDKIIGVKTVGDVTQDDGATVIVALLDIGEGNFVHRAGIGAVVPTILVVLSLVLGLGFGLVVLIGGGQQGAEIDGILGPDSGNGIESHGEVPVGHGVEQGLVLGVQDTLEGRGQSAFGHLRQAKLSGAGFKTAVNLLDQSRAPNLLI